MPVEDASARSFAPGSHPSAGGQDAQAGALSGAGEGEHPRSQKVKGQLAGVPPPGAGGEA